MTLPGLLSGEWITLAVPSGHFYLAHYRTLLLGSNNKSHKLCQTKVEMSGCSRLEMSGFVNKRV